MKEIFGQNETKLIQSFSLIYDFFYISARNSFLIRSKKKKKLHLIQQKINSNNIANVTKFFCVCF